MLQFTKRTEYGLIALVHLTDRAGGFVSAREISDSYPVPKRLLAEVLKDLSRAGLVESLRGSAGGYRLARSPFEISLVEVVTALEGTPSVSVCESLGAYRNGHCDVDPVCPIKSPIHRIRQNILQLLKKTTLADLSANDLSPESVANGSRR